MSNTQQVFNQTVLDSLLRGDAPAADRPVTLFALQLDNPLGYVLESERWDETSGAAQRLARAGTRIREVLAADGYTPEDTLHLTPSSMFVLCHDPTLATRWRDSIQRAVALETDIVTVSSAAYTLPAGQMLQGLYRAPRSVIGVPGVNDYQERINRYYGLASPSTVPREDVIAQRRHFGEAVALLHGLLSQSAESRQVFPFYEVLPFAERCASCRIRPAEQFDSDYNAPVCGVCARKRSAAQADDIEKVSLVWIEAADFDSVLEQQRSPLAYRRVCQELNETLRKAIPERSGAVVLARGNGYAVFALPVADALETVSAALESVMLHYGLKAPAPFIAAVALGTGSRQLHILRRLIEKSLAHVRRSSPVGPASIDIRLCDQPFDRTRSPFTLDEARQLIAGIAILREANLPDGLFLDSPDQAARGGAGPYYSLERSKLPQPEQQALQRLERAWEVGGAPGPRFFAMLATALSLARSGA